MGTPTCILDAAAALGINPADLATAQPLTFTGNPLTPYLTSEVTMSSTTTARPFEHVFNANLAAIILVDPANTDAIAEAFLRLDHGATLRPQNRRILNSALTHIASLAEVPQPAPPAPVKATPKPKPAPKVKPVKVLTPAQAFQVRVQNLADGGQRMRLGMRAFKVATVGGFTAEDLATLSDTEALDLVARPIR